LGDGFGLVGGLVQRLGDFLNVCHGAKVSVAEFCLIWIRKLIGYNRLVSIYRNFLVSLYYYAEVEMRFFETRFLKEVDTFFEQLDKKVVVKKTQKTPKAEIDRALTLRSKYFDLS
jgi:hypothetical protein